MRARSRKIEPSILSDHKERVRLRVSPRRRGRLGYTAKIVYKLISYMYHRLIKLTSTKRGLNFAARVLKISIKYRKHGGSLRMRGSSEAKFLKTHKVLVPLGSPTGHGDIFIDFWHCLKRKHFKLQVVRACTSIPRKLFALAQYFSIEASNFVTCHVPRWIEDYDMKEIEESSKEMIAKGKQLEDIIYQPSGFLDLGDVSSYTPKIPLKRFESGLQSALTTKRQRNGKSANEKMVFQRNPKGVAVDERRLRQTRIEEFFKPRRLLTTTAKNEVGGISGASGGTTNGCKQE